MPSSCHRCPARLPAARHLCASVIAENCCNGDQTLCKSFFACPSSIQPPTGQSKWLFLWPFLFVFHIVCFLAPQLLTASWTMPFHMYTPAWLNVCLCVCVCVSCTIFTSPLVLVTFWVCSSTCFTFLLSSPPCGCMWTTLLAFSTYRWLLGWPLLPLSLSYPLLSSVSVLFSMPRALFGLLHVLSPSRVGGCRAKAKFTGVGHKCH